MSNDKNKPIDLSSMESFAIEPSWVKKNTDSKNYGNFGGKERKPQGDRRGDRRSKDTRKNNPGQVKVDDHWKRGPRFEFRILPEREVLEKIKSEMRKTGVSYALTNICETISAKAERYSIKMKFKEDGDGRFIKTIVDQMIFSSKENAVDHLLKNSFEKSFLKELDLEEKPIKNFSYVYQCNKTNSLLPPNNYHRYEEIIKQHMFLNDIKEEYIRYTSKLQKIDDADKIKLWMETPLKIYKFAIIKDKPIWHKGIDQLRNDLLREMPSSLFEIKDIFKISGSSINVLETNIAEQFKTYYNFKLNWINQLFSSCLVNLKKSNFTIFKFSEKKHTYACAYKKRTIEGKKLGANSEKIINLLKKSSQIKKSNFIKDKGLEDIGPRDILIELKWLVKEGYIYEFPNGSIGMN